MSAAGPKGPAALVCPDLPEACVTNRQLRRLHKLRLAASALALLGIVELLLRTTSLPRTCALLRVDREAPRYPRSSLLSAPEQALAVDVVEVVGRVAARWPFGDTCLRRTLVLAALLRDLQPVVALGVRRDDAGAFSAHSWVVIGGESFDPAAADFLELR